ncbi:MAG: Pepco domain-containing protein [Nostoc sp.]
MQEETISIITDDIPLTPVAETRSWEVPAEATIKHKIEISVDKLEQEMGRFLHIVHRLFQRAEQEADKKSGMQLDEIELSVEINGEGKVSLIGSGAKAGGKGAITLKFKRPELQK